ncbi:MAG: hypothetical protein L0287_26380 [Anaerolineae bacterium]|nr:hypothetical protein [Anaerolineae bacterium]
MNVYIFYNNDEFHAAKDNAWEKFKGVDTARLFLACAESWRRNGWNPVRISTKEATEFDVFTGQITKSFHWYPQSYWRFIPHIRERFKDAYNPQMFTTIDVFNYGFSPLIAEGLSGSGCISFQREHFSMSTILCNRQWRADALNCLIRYDRGELPALNHEYVSDETILREYGSYEIFPIQSFPISPSAMSSSLLHYARSAVSRAIDNIPTLT